jgi:hypothetical protein
MGTRTTHITQLQFRHDYCTGIAPGAPAQEVLDLLRAQGAAFLDLGGQPIGDPVEYTDDDGKPFIDPPYLQYRTLAPECSTLGAASPRARSPDAGGSGSFGYFADSQSVKVSQWAEFPDGRSPDWMAEGLLALAVDLYPALRPAYGWVDEFGWNVLPDSVVAALRPVYLYWATFYGPAWVDRLGRDFLLGAPGWRVVDLEDGGLLHVATESYEQWWQEDQAALLSYFRRRYPKAHLYRATPVPY